VKKPSVKALYISWMLFGALLMALALSSAQRPLQSVHWDTPIYLYQAKRIAESALLVSYSTHALEIAEQAGGYRPLPLGERYPEAYWRFSRLGHIAILGGIVTLAGSSETAILAATHVYALFMVLGTLFSVLMVQALFHLYQPPGDDPALPGRVALVSGLAFGLTGTFIYMAGNLVPEVPTFPAVSAGTWLMVLALSRNRTLPSMAAGLLAGLTFMVKMEAVWLFIAAWLAFLIAPPTGMPRQQVARLLSWSAGSAIVVYGLHSVLFYPLGAPWVFLEFQQRVSQALPPAEAHWPALAAAGGILWLCVPAAALAGFGQPLSRFAWIWLLLCMLPLSYILASGEVQTRMFVTLVPSLMLLASVGGYAWWSRRRSTSTRRAALTVFAVMAVSGFLIAHPASYVELRQLPGGWRLQYVRQFLWPAAYEVNAYPVAATRQLAEWLYSQPSSYTLVVAGDIPQEHLNLVRFFGPTYPVSADLALAPDPTNLLPCDIRRQLPYEPIAYRLGLRQDCCNPKQAGRVFYLGRAGSVAAQDMPTLYQSGEYRISRYCS